MYRVITYNSASRNSFFCIISEILMPTLGNRAYLELRQRLADGEFAPGSQLVNRTISEKVGMSMTPVREAIARLASEGLVHYIPGAGSYVRTVSRDELAQLYDLREVLEPFAAGLAASHITANELDEIRAVCRTWKKIVHELIAAALPHATASQMLLWNNCERRFHELIFKASRNTWLFKIVGDLQLMAFGFCPLRAEPEFLTLDNARITYRDHLKILKLLSARDAPRLRTVIRRHIRVGRERVLQFLDHRSVNQTTSPTSTQVNVGKPPVATDDPQPITVKDNPTASKNLLPERGAH